MLLRSICNILLWFSRNCFFHNFDWSKVFFNRSKLRLKFWFVFVCFDRCSIGSGSIEAFSTNRIYFLINRKSYREFFLKLSFSHVLHHSNFVQNSFSIYSIGPRVEARFLSFSTKFLQLFLSLYTTQSRLQSTFLSFFSILFASFSSPKASKTFIPFILHLFSLFMHQIMHYLGNFKPM